MISDYQSSLTESSETLHHLQDYLGIGCFYESLRINVSVDGTYRFRSNSTMDTYGYLYNNTFNSSNLRENLLTQDDENGGEGQFLIMQFIRTLTTYVLVVTTYEANVTGPFTACQSSTSNEFDSNRTTVYSATLSLSLCHDYFVVRIFALYFDFDTNALTIILPSFVLFLPLN